MGASERELDHNSLLAAVGVSDWAQVSEKWITIAYSQLLEGASEESI